MSTEWYYTPQKVYKLLARHIISVRGKKILRVKVKKMLRVKKYFSFAVGETNEIINCMGSTIFEFIGGVKTSGL